MHVAIARRWKNARDEQGDDGAAMSILNFGKGHEVGVRRRICVSSHKMRGMR